MCVTRTRKQCSECAAVKCVRCALPPKCAFWRNDNAMLSANFSTAHPDYKYRSNDLDECRRFSNRNACSNDIVSIPPKLTIGELKLLKF